MEELLREIKKYFKLLNRNTITKWNQGHFLSNSKELREKEGLFLKLVPIYEKEIIKLIKKYPESKNVIYYISLLEWGRDTKKISEFLISILNHNKSHKIHNYTARALFPLVVSGKVKINIDEFLKLLDHNNKYCKNKALGILAFLPLSDNDKEKLNIRLLDFKKLANSSSDSDIISKPAKLLLKRL